MTLRIKRTAKTISARASERALIKTTAKLANEQRKRLTVSLTATGRKSQ